MRMKRILSSVIGAALLAACLPCNFASAANEFLTENPTERNVYLHAGEQNPAESARESTMYKNESGNIYLAVDNPNKTDFDESGEPNVPRYCMNGYTVKFYYNSDYFTLDSGMTSPINVDIHGNDFSDWQQPPDDDIGEIDESIPEDGEEDTDDSNLNQKCYRVISSGSETDCVSIDGETYSAAFVTVFFQGFCLPEKTWDGWYDLCALPLTPTKNGTTNLYINTYQQSDHRLELFAKNETDKIEDQTFAYNLMNNGMHTVNITDRGTPAPPSASVKPGRYTTAQEVELTAEEGCTVWWKDSTMDKFVSYTDKISVASSTVIECYAQRGEGEDVLESVHKSYQYNIVPQMPSVFVKNEDGSVRLLENSVYYEPTDVYSVYASDTDDFDRIMDDTVNIYYTFREALSTDDIDGDNGKDPFTEWVKLDRSTGAIPITKSCTLRLVTEKTNTVTDEVEFSDVKICNLGIRPAAVTASHESDTYTETIHVTLSCTTTGATVYYTLDGKNPLTDGHEYAGNPITISTNTTLRAAAKFDGIDGSVSSYFYLFDTNEDYGVQAFYPPAVYEGGVTVTLIADNPENSIKYRFEGESELKDYNGEVLTITDSTTIYVKAGKDGDWAGSEQELKYEIKPLPPLFSPPSAQFTNADKVTVSCPESTDKETAKRFRLYYTTDGSDPVTNGKLAENVGDNVTLDISKYTVIKAVVEKDDGNYSTVVTHAYDVVTNRPTKPMMTLDPGIYIRKIGDSKGYTTQFVPVTGDVNIYYRTDGHEPIVGDGDFYQKYEPIALRGHTVVKAIAADSTNTKSDAVLFDYTIVPEAPKAAPSATDLSELPVIKVEAVADDNNIIIYRVGEFHNSFFAKDCTNGVFYIDLTTGNAYKTSARNASERLGAESTETFTDSAYLSIKSVLDGVESDTNEYLYAVSERAEDLSMPYADKDTGEYEEAADSDGDYLKINLSSPNTDDEIQYQIGSNGEWTTYNGAIGITKDTILRIRSKKNADGNDIYSGIKSYVYTFVPLPPVLTLESGRYLKADNKTTTVKLDDNAPTNEKYTIYIRKNGGDKDDPVDNNQRFGIDSTISFKAYVVNEKTQRKSKNTVRYYIIETESLSGKVGLEYPYHEVKPNVTKRLNADLLSGGKYAEGIKLYTGADAVIHYEYTYSYLDEDTNETKTVSSEKLVYKNTPIMVNPNMTSMKIKTWLTDEAGNEIANSRSDYEMEFVHLKTPKISQSDGKCTLVNDYPNDTETTLYYTLDGSDPTDETNANRKIYNGETITLTDGTTVKAAYANACGTCENCIDGNHSACSDAVYGKIAEYKHTVQYVSSGGGGGRRVVDNTRTFTKDVFGNEHPTHISYINGYPDGSVKPDGNITREEVTAILYRVTGHEYESPFAASGDRFPDVQADRWSAHDIEYMAGKDIVTGYPDGEFKPQRNLTRAEFAALICRFAKLEKSNAENPFPDLSDMHWAYDNILSLAESKLVEGYEDGTFKPENEITRAEVMTVMNKLLGRNPSESYVKTLEFTPYTDLEKDKWYYTAVLEATVTHDYYLNQNGLEYKWENWK